jgi:DNA helicase-2/ATP-dependent DNA helicase PcrA
VGDDDQSIYSWRGADIRNILEFERDYDDTKVITLEYNYRSTRPILDAAASVIANNRMRKQKDIKPYRGEGEPVVWCMAGNEYMEAEFVVYAIQTLKKRERLTNGDFSIFYRTNAQSRVFEECLRREKLPYRVLGGLRFYDRKEIKDIIAYLKFISNPYDQVSMLRIINMPPRGIGPATIEKIRDFAREKAISFWDAACSMPDSIKLPGSIREFVKLIKLCREHASSESVTSLSKIASRVIEASGYKRHYQDDKSIENRSRLENIDEFVNSVYDYEAMNPTATLNEFLQDISLLTSEEDPSGEKSVSSGQITLMTVHNAKGLEFPVVFLTGMEEGTFPHMYSINSEEEIEEERRLCYVGITRAMETLYITSAEFRRSWNELVPKMPSRFIEELPKDQISITRYDGAYREIAPQRTIIQKKVSKVSVLKAASSEKIATSSQTPSSYRVGGRVSHEKYGAGRVIKIEGNGENTKLTVQFGESSKVFIEKYTPLKKLN